MILTVETQVEREPLEKCLLINIFVTRFVQFIRYSKSLLEFVLLTRVFFLKMIMEFCTLKYYRIHFFYLLHLDITSIVIFFTI